MSAPSASNEPAPDTTTPTGSNHKDQLGTEELDEESATTLTNALTAAKLESIRHNRAALRTFAHQCTQVSMFWLQRADPRTLIIAGLGGRANDWHDAAQPARPIVWVRNVELGVKGTPYVDSGDLGRFSARVDALFDWHIDQDAAEPVGSFHSPSFAIIQSSGMGKTKLLHEYKEQMEPVYADRAVLLIRCKERGTSPGLAKESIYQRMLTIPSARVSQPGAVRGDLVQQLEEIVHWNTLGSMGISKVVLLLDEAQHLLEEDGFAFRCVCWWLMKRSNTKLHSIVAVFAGTSPLLANFHHEPWGATPSSDDNELYRDCDMKLYPPFFDLCTVGCLSGSGTTKKEATAGANETIHEAEDTVTDVIYDYKDLYRAIPYGRPSFKLLRDNNELSRALPVILQQILLDESDWLTNQAVHFSVLATRVQMGQTSTHIVHKLVGKGFANLTDFTIENQKRSTDCTRLGRCHANMDEQGIAELCYPTDPVCAFLAMRLMNAVDDGDNNRTVPKAQAVQHKAQTPKFWTAKALELCGSGMCQPNNGDLGEIGAALYLLFCGDRLRKIEDPTYQTFTISFNAWLEMLKEPSKAPRPGTANHERTISFVQLQRLNLRLPLKQMISQAFLRNLYESGTACYLYAGCPVFDIVASIKAGDTYTPLLISVKAGKAFTNDDVNMEQYSMQKECEVEHLPPAVCLLLLIGRDQQCTTNQGTDLENTMLTRSKAPAEETLMREEDLLCVHVPDDDPFGVTDFVLGTTSEKEIAEIYSSHKYIRNCFHEKAAKAESLLRTKRPKDMVFKHDEQKLLGKRTKQKPTVDVVVSYVTSIMESCIATGAVTTGTDDSTRAIDDDTGFTTVS